MDYDWNKLAWASRKQGLDRPGPADMAAVGAAFDSLAHIQFPSGYLDSVRRDVLLALANAAAGRGAATSVYASFFGDDRADNMKIGVASSVKSRIDGIRTSNPAPHLWTWAAELESKTMAHCLEKILHKHLAASRRSGEWFSCNCSDESEAEQLVASIQKYARSVVGFDAAEFRRVGV